MCSVFGHCTNPSSTMRIIKVISILAMISAVFTTYAEESHEAKKINPKEIVNQIVENSNGNVNIEMTNDLYELLIPQKKNLKPTNRKGIYRTHGYRIQVFSDGRNQHTLEARANARGNAILAKFPKYRGQVYTFSKLPNWFTRVGNFETIEEANEALKELKRAFPSFAGEMRTVNCEVLIRK